MREIPDRVSANQDSPFYMEGCSRIGVRFNGTEQSKVVEFCVSEGWIIRYKQNALGRPVKNGENWVLMLPLNGLVEVYWRQ